mmetsp:Transcript_6909/g.18109  ORF Transcript_6909/g.18109 Transcript_6909/m.18109 type:complete len:248 (-) Transcript_6909:629-1372(-)
MSKKMFENTTPISFFKWSRKCSNRQEKRRRLSSSTAGRGHTPFLSSERQRYCLTAAMKRSPCRNLRPDSEERIETSSESESSFERRSIDSSPPSASPSGSGFIDNLQSARNTRNASRCATDTPPNPSSCMPPTAGGAVAGTVMCLRAVGCGVEGSESDDFESPCGCVADGIEPLAVEAAPSSSSPPATEPAADAAASRAEAAAWPATVAALVCAANSTREYTMCSIWLSPPSAVARMRADTPTRCKW